MPDNIDDDPILKLVDIHKSFGGVRALEGANLELQPGEIHALVGENGAGKSTLVRVITGVHHPDSGHIFHHGKPVSIPNPLVAHHLGIAAIYQETSLFPDLTIAENIFMGHQPLSARTRLIDWRKMNEMAAQPLRDLGVDLSPRKRVRDLTIAQMEMVEIAKALSFNAQVLIMDEPTSALTLHEVEDLFRIIRRLRDDGRAVVFISHRLDEVLELADRVTVLRDGHYVGTHLVKDITHSDLIRLMVGRTLETLFPKQEVTRGDVILQVQGLTRRGVFKDISFDLHRGEILGLAGLVGARRTDVAQALFGIAPADAGTIDVDGHPVQIKNTQQAMALGLALVPENRQSDGLVLPMSVTKNITLPILQQFTRVNWLDEAEENRRAAEFADRLEVRSAGLEQRVRDLSGGNQQKVVLAKWLVTLPRILILDEPTRGIDVGTKAAVHELMSKLASQGLAILMISSELPEVLGMSDRILVMCEGHLTGQFTRAEATQEKIMTAAMARSAGSDILHAAVTSKAEKGD